MLKSRKCAINKYLVFKAGIVSKISGLMIHVSYFKYAYAIHNILACSITRNTHITKKTL